MGLTCSRVTSHRPPTPPSPPQPSRGRHASQPGGAASAHRGGEEVREAAPAISSVSLVEGTSRDPDPDPVGLEELHSEGEGSDGVSEGTITLSEQAREINRELTKLVTKFKETIPTLADPRHRMDNAILEILRRMPSDGIDVEDSQDGSVMATLRAHNLALREDRYKCSSGVRGALINYLNAFNDLDTEYSEAVNPPHAALVPAQGGGYHVVPMDRIEYGLEAGA